METEKQKSWLGKPLRAAVKREDVFLASKVLPSNASYERTIKSCRQSLRRLNTDYLDLYLLHWPSGSHAIGETMHAMERLVSDGLVRYIGVSNFGVEELKEAERALRNERIACNQVLHHLGYRGIENSILPYCAKQEIAVVGYSPFGHNGGLFSSSSSQSNSKLRLLEDIAKRHGKTPRQVALNFLTNVHPTNIFTIPKASNPNHVRENSESVGWDLTEDEIASSTETARRRGASRKSMRGSRAGSRFSGCGSSRKRPSIRASPRRSRTSTLSSSARAASSPASCRRCWCAA